MQSIYFDDDELGSKIRLLMPPSKLVKLLNLIDVKFDASNYVEKKRRLCTLCMKHAIYSVNCNVCFALTALRQYVCLEVNCV